MDHDTALQAIAMLGEEPEKSMAATEFKKTRYSTKALVSIYRLVLQQPGNAYSEKITSFAQKFLEKVDEDSAKRRRYIVNLRVSAEEKAELESYAQTNGETVSQYIRRVVFGKEDV